jgi:DNA invertase Pin-like site-specific DNA recombinase
LADKSHASAAVAAVATKGRAQRPGLDAMLKDASRGRSDVVIAWSPKIPVRRPTM